MKFGFLVVCYFLTSYNDNASAQTATVNPETVELTFDVRDADGKGLPCRVHLKDENNKAVRVDNFVYWNDHFVCKGKATVELKPGKYSWSIEKGPEFERKSGTLQLKSKPQELPIRLRRIADMRSEGWISGDMHIHRSPEHIRLLMRAEDLAFAPVITWWNRPASKTPPPAQTVFQFDKFRVYTTMAGEDERTGGALLFFGMDRPLDLTVKSKNAPRNGIRTAGP